MAQKWWDEPCVEELSFCGRQIFCTWLLVDQTQTLRRTFKTFCSDGRVTLGFGGSCGKKIAITAWARAPSRPPPSPIPLPRKATNVE